MCVCVCVYITETQIKHVSGKTKYVYRKRGTKKKSRVAWRRVKERGESRERRRRGDCAASPAAMVFVFSFARLEHRHALDPESRAASVQRYIAGKRVPSVLKLPVSFSSQYRGLFTQQTHSHVTSFCSRVHAEISVRR